MKTKKKEFLSRTNNFTVDFEAINVRNQRGGIISLRYLQRSGIMETIIRYNTDFALMIVGQFAENNRGNRFAARLHPRCVCVHIVPRAELDVHFHAMCYMHSS